MNKSQQILIICIFWGIGIVAVFAGIVMYMNAGSPVVTPSERIQVSPLALQVTDNNTPAGMSGDILFLSTFDRSTGNALGSVSVYLDGGYEGSTSVQGSLGIPNYSLIPQGGHTIRVTKTGYTDYTERIVIPAPSSVNIGLQAQMLVPVQESGTHNSRIDIVFVPSKTSYNCAEQKKITGTRYITDKKSFVTDVNRIVTESLFTLDSVTDRANPIPTDYRDRFNVYYYYNPVQFADAFNGCAGTIPEDVWETAPFADIVIILYPTYYTVDTGAPCEPNACVNPGTGRSWMKIPADQNVLFLHESGHAIFGLIDTYCGSTVYWQNDPDPNVWLSRENCMDYAKSISWDPSACRQIQLKSPTACTKQFWRWDADPDIMHEGYSGTFGKASTRRMNYIFNNIDTWG